MFHYKNSLYPGIKNIAWVQLLLPSDRIICSFLEICTELTDFVLIFFFNFQSCLCCCCSQSKSLVTSVPMNGTSIQWKNQELNNHNTDRSSHKDSINWKLRTLIPLQKLTTRKKSQQSYFNRKPSDCCIITSDMCTLVPRGDREDWLTLTVMFCELRCTGW